MGYLDEVFRQTADGGYFDFTRCQRPDGSYYGTSGSCNKGTKVGARAVDATKKAGAGAAAPKQKLGGVKVGTEKRLLGLSVDQLKQLRSDPRLYDYQKEKIDAIISKKGASPAKPETAASKAARPVDPKVAAKVDKAIAAKAKGPGYTPEQLAAQDALLKKKQDATTKKDEREKRRADLIERIKKQEGSKYNKTLADVDRQYKMMKEFVKQPGMDIPENRAAVTAMRALRMKMVYADIEKFRAKNKAKMEGLENSPRYSKTPGSTKPLSGEQLGDKASSYLSLKAAVEKRQKKLDALEKLPWEERKAKGYQKLDDEQSADRGAMIRLSRQRDFIELNKIYEEQGFNSKPELLKNRAELEKRNDLITRDDGRPLVLYRGVQAEEFADQFRGVGKDGGIHFAGKGIYGNGTYAASAVPKGDDVQAQKTAKEYAGWNSTPQMVTAFGLRKDANIVDFSKGDLNERFNAYADWGKDIQKKASERTGLPVEDIGHAAAIMGIHAYRVPQDDREDYWVILNRGAVVAAADAQL